MMSWEKSQPNLIGKVIYPFNINNDKCLKLQIGDTVVIRSRNGDWYYGYCLLKCLSDSSKGIFPCNYVILLGEDDDSSADKEKKFDSSSTDKIKSKILKSIVVHTSIWLSPIMALQKENDMKDGGEIEIQVNKLIELFYEIANCSNKEKLLKFQNQSWIFLCKISSLLNIDAVIKTKKSQFLSVANFPIIQLEQMYLEEPSTTFDQRSTINASNSSLFTLKAEVLQANHLQVLVENAEFTAWPDELVLEWMIVDIMSEWHFEPFWQPIKEFKKGRPPWMGEKFLFKAFPGEIRKDGVYIVVYVYRIGQLLADSKTQLTGKFRRPLAFGSCSLKEIGGNNDKTIINLYNLSEMDYMRPTKELIRMRLPAQAQNRFIHISIDILDQINPPLDEFDDSHILESISFINDISYNIDTDRHCLFLRFENAEFERANKKTPRNVEAQISVKNVSGQKQKCISINPDINNKIDYFSSVTYHCNSPKWKDIIKINLKEINAEDCHIFIDFYHCTTKDKKGDERKYFASCFMRFKEFYDCGTLKKTFVLIPQKISTSSKQDPKNYLKGNSMILGELDKNTTREHCKISLTLCSSHLSENKAINDFMFKVSKGNNISVDQLKRYLKEIQIINNEDFRKPQLRKNITSVIESNFLGKMCASEETVQIQLFITWQILSYKFVKFGMIDELLSHMKGKFEFVDYLLKGIQYVLRLPRSAEISFETLVIVISSLEPIFMILSTYSDEEYHFQISERIKEILMRSLAFFESGYTAEPSKDIRALIFDYTIENLKYWQHLTSIDIVIKFFNSLLNSRDFLDEKILPTEKLDFMWKLLKSDLHIDCTEMLLIWFSPIIEICSRLIDISSPNILQSTEILLYLFHELKQYSQEDRIKLFSKKSMKSFFTKSFSVLLARQYKDQQVTNKNKYLIKQEKEDMTTAIEGIASIEIQKMYTLVFAYLDEWCDIEDSDIGLMELFVVLNNIKTLIECSPYPKRWLSMTLKICQIYARILKKTASYLQERNEDVFKKILPVFFEACYPFIMHSQLQLQNYLLSKSQRIIDEYGDMRMDVMEYFFLVWKMKPLKPDSFEKKFTLQTTMRVLNISFLPVSGIRSKTIPLLLHTISNWINICNDTEEVLRELISETEMLLRNGSGNEDYYELLSDVINLGRLPEEVLMVIKTFTSLIKLHLENRQLSNGAFSVLHSQFLLYEFTKFYQEEVNIFSHFRHYSDQLSELLQTDEYYFEAALILKQQYDCIAWKTEDNNFDPIFFENYEEFGNEEKKEQLRKKILDLLDKTKEYEYAADLCKELYKYYLTTKNFKELGPLLRQCATFYENIMTEPRLQLNYYRVTFIGGILPSYMKKNRDYIIKGSMWFKINSLKTILKESFPDAEIQFYQSTSPTESHYEQKMVIYIAKMEPVPFDIDLSRNRKISTKVRSFYKDHRLIRFTSDHPFHKGTIDKDNEIKTLHISRVTVMTEIMMPNHFMWSPIVFEERITMTPIEVAIDTVLMKNEMFREMIDEYGENPQKDLRPFSMLLNGTLDAGVNGGMPKYIEAFFSENSSQESEATTEQINLFRDVLIEQKNVLSEALAIHKKLALPSIQPMHERLENCHAILSKTVLDLNILRKRSFSTMRTLSEVYIGTSEILFDSPSIEKDFSFFRETSRISETHFSHASFDTTRSSDEALSNYSSSRNSDLDKTFIAPRRKVSSTNEEEITKLAREYLDNKETNLYSINPSISTPEIRSKYYDSPIDEKISSPVKSPPLPPNDDEPACSLKKTKPKNFFSKLTYRKGSKDLSIGNQTINNGKLSLEKKQRPKLGDTFWSADKSEYIG